MGKSKPGKSLKSSLLAHQKRQTHNVEQAAKHAAIESKVTKADKAGTSKKRKKAGDSRNPTIPFSSIDRILLIGEGNFSFAHSLLDHPSIPSLPPANITATAYDSESDCLSKYPDAQSHISALRSAGATVLFGVDARHLDKTFPLKTGKKWDKVVWNFPHVGLSITDQDRNIAANQSTLLGFLASVKPYLAEGAVPDRSPSVIRKKAKPAEENFSDDDEESMMFIQENKHKTAGSILITLREQEPYTLWDLSRLAKSPVVTTSRNTLPQPRYIQIRSFTFHPEVYPGYEHRRTAGWDEMESPLVGPSKHHAGGLRKKETGPCRTWEFVLRPEQ
ncbi:unnamed protein product [Rhizoctonia solani]|uniref:25S rRNA (uridine-N(3))-methyltransferase BMT5-like domain-containing protein n=3 Tax=Rhizoctonia solani TaxID=456999 RepID=A0A8H2WLH4_9AGAM|nr:genomic scaffold, msy-sf-11 protein, putative [Rhizoctonia solani AG-3 Rhs1AP]KEP47753.1 putative genomic scaffold, msy-sf-11 protein [Rhizoctonia solani 123E]CAE6364403.1 unnamed protein product [Rhizoctonia solani]CAE6385387.1 unnamed protein product [Rhizoctonia solani]